MAIMTGGIGAGLAVAGVAAYAGGKTELRGGNMADVATAMGGASLAAGVAGNVVPVLPAVAKAGIGIAGTIGFTVKGVNDARAAGETFSNPQASTKEKILSGLSVVEDIAGLTSSAILAYHGLSDLVGVSNIARPTEIKSPDGTSRSVECGGKGKNALDNGLEPNKGFSSFDALKKYIGSAGKGRHWHHIVEQSQIDKSGFDPELIHNTNNIISVDAATHAKITGYYSRKNFNFTGGLSVRDWLAGQSYDFQYEFGLNVLRDYGVIP